MKKKICVIFFIVLYITILVIGIVVRVKVSDSYYPLSGIVTEIDKNEDKVTFTDGNGNLWTFDGVEDWMIDDAVAVIMDDNHTQTIFDDKIIKVRYCGRFN